MALIIRQFSLKIFKAVLQKFSIPNLQNFFLHGLEDRQVISNLRMERWKDTNPKIIMLFLVKAKTN